MKKRNGMVDGANGGTRKLASIGNHRHGKIQKWVEFRLLHWMAAGGKLL